jgi:hypothetical protein
MGRKFGFRPIANVGERVVPAWAVEPGAKGSIPLLSATIGGQNMAPDFLTLQGKQIPFARERVPIAKCALDPANPRIQYMIGQRAGAVSDGELDDLIWEKDQVKYLAESIFQNGGVYEDIIVQRQDEKYLVREGNCRKVACSHLLDRYPGDARFATIPARVFDGDLSEEDLAVLLADMHVASKIKWDAYEQAKHVHDLLQIYGKTYDWLSNHLRLSKSKVRELVSAYKATRNFLEEHPNPENIRKFSFFHELTKKSNLRDRFEFDQPFKQTFFRWVAQERITDAKQIRRLPEILANQEAAKVLDTKGFEAAMDVLRREDPSLQSDLFWAVKNSTEKLREAPMSDITDLQSNPQKLIMLRNLHRALEDLATLAGVKL